MEGWRSVDDGSTLRRRRDECCYAAEEGGCEGLMVDDLPNEIALHVLSYLGPREVCIVGFVSRHWHKLALDSTLWRSLYMRELHGVRERKRVRLHTSSTASSLAATSTRSSAGSAGRDWREMFKKDCLTKRSWMTGSYTPQDTVTTSSSVYAVKFDEEKVVCGMQDSHIRVYDRKTSKLTLTLSGHRDWVGAVQYDDEKIVSCSGDMHIRVWNWAGVCTKKLKGHTGWVKRLQYDDEVLVSCSGDKSVKLWRWSDTSEPTSTLIGHTDGVMGLQFADNTIVSGSLDGTICMWDADTESRLFTLHNLDKENRRSEVRCLVFDRDSIVSGDSDFMVKIWDWNTGQPRRTLKGHQGYVKYVYADDYKIVSGGGDGTIRVWDYRGTSDAPLYTIQAHARDIINMDVHENAFASGSLDDSLRMWLIG